MEHLSKQQMILVTLLVAIVTSIVTGVVIVSLSEQIITGNTQPITETVVKTIERVIQPATSTPARVITTTQNVVVSYEDKAADAIEKIKPYTFFLEPLESPGSAIAIAVPIADNLLVSVRPLNGFWHTMTAVDMQGNRYQLTGVPDAYAEIGYYRIASSAKVKALPKTMVSADPRIGQSVMTYGGGYKTERAGFGNVLTAPKVGQNTTVPSATTNLILQPSGSVILAPDGKFLGIHAPDMGGSFIPASWLFQLPSPGTATGTVST